MESLLIWAAAAVLILGIFVPYLLKFKKQQKLYHEQKQEAIFLGADKPFAQYPQIDVMRCIGCAACVSACPEGDVLGIVHGKATVINGLKCVGHGRCAEACPVQGIVVGLGDVEKRDDIPILNEVNETNIKGLFIAGELGGLALIRNAISQGKMVVDAIAATIKRTEGKSVHDVLIVGAGPAGISAALTAQKHHLSYLVLDQQGLGGTILQYPRKKIVMTQPVDMPLYGLLDKPEYSKEELLQIWQKIHDRFKLNLRSGEKIQNIEKNFDVFKVTTRDQAYYSKTVVLAMGRRGIPRKLGVPGEELPKVMYKLIDAESYTNSRLLVVGGGDSAVEAVIGLTQQKGNTITVSYRKSKFFRLKKKNDERILQIIKENKAEIIYDSEVKEISAFSVRLQTVKGEVVLDNDYVFVFAGGEPPLQFLKQIGIAFGGEQEVHV
jgi:thioredoxin reductase (NADPH)